MNRNTAGGISPGHRHARGSRGSPSNTEVEVLSAQAGVSWQITKLLARVPPVFTTQAAILLLVTSTL